MVTLYGDETIEDLQRDGFRLIQKRDGFRFGTDSVLLAALAAQRISGSVPLGAGRESGRAGPNRPGTPRRSRRPSEPIRVCDLGCGAGAVLVLMAARLPDARFLGLEAIPRIAEMAERTLVLNGLTDRASILAGDLRRSALSIPEGSADLVVSNPPYRAVAETERIREPVESLSRDQELRIAREEHLLPLEDLVRHAARLLKPGAPLALVHHPSRLPDLLETLRRHRLEPECLRLVHPLPDRAPTGLFLVAVRDGRPGGFRVGPPLVILSAPGVPSDEMECLYGRDRPLSLADPEE